MSRTKERTRAPKSPTYMSSSSSIDSSPQAIPIKKQKFVLNPPKSTKLKSISPAIDEQQKLDDIERLNSKLKEQIVIVNDQEYDLEQRYLTKLSDLIEQNVIKSEDDIKNIRNYLQHELKSFNDKYILPENERDMEIGFMKEYAASLEVVQREYSDYEEIIKKDAKETETLVQELEEMIENCSESRTVTFHNANLLQQIKSYQVLLENVNDAINFARKKKDNIVNVSLECSTEEISNAYSTLLYENFYLHHDEKRFLRQIHLLKDAIKKTENKDVEEKKEKIADSISEEYEILQSKKELLLDIHDGIDTTSYNRPTTLDIIERSQFDQVYDYFQKLDQIQNNYYSLLLTQSDSPRKEEVLNELTKEYEEIESLTGDLSLYQSLEKENSSLLYNREKYRNILKHAQQCQINYSQYIQTYDELQCDLSVLKAHCDDDVDFDQGKIEEMKDILFERDALIKTLQTIQEFAMKCPCSNPQYSSILKKIESKLGFLSE